MKRESGLKEEVIIQIPGSKSISQRVLMAAALADGRSVIKNVLLSQDTQYLMEGLRTLGASIETSDDGFAVSGTAGQIAGGHRELFLGNNGTALRFLTALVCLGQGSYRLTGEKRLCERPVGPLAEALRQMGVDIRTHNQCPPVEVHARGLAGGKVHLRDIESSQYVSALLLCAPYMREGVEVVVEGHSVSAPYIQLTMDVMRDFGADIVEIDKNHYRVTPGKTYGARTYVVEGDASSASYFFLAAAILKRTIRVEGIRRNSHQGDIRFLDILEMMGCRIVSDHQGVVISGNPIAPGNFSFDLNDMPDMVPTLAILSAFLEGQTVIRNVAHLRVKESDRIAAMVAELRRVGIGAEELPDGMVIQGGTMRPGQIETYRDHRIAMSFAVAGLAIPGIEIVDRTCVDKSFPTFWDELGKL